MKMKAVTILAMALVFGTGALMTPTDSMAQSSEQRWGSGHGNDRNKAREAGKKAAEDRKSGQNKSDKMTAAEKEAYRDAKDKGLEEDFKRGYRDGQ